MPVRDDEPHGKLKHYISAFDFSDKINWGRRIQRIVSEHLMAEQEMLAFLGVKGNDSSASSVSSRSVHPHIHVTFENDAAWQSYFLGLAAQSPD